MHNFKINSTHPKQKRNVPNVWNVMDIKNIANLGVAPWLNNDNSKLRF